MMAIICTIHFTLLLATSIIVWAQQAKVRDSDLPYAINDLRLKPDFCAGMLPCCHSTITFCVPSTYLCILSGFRITYPAKHGEKLTWGEMGLLSWEVDTAMEKIPDLITRIRLVDDIGRNTQLIGENISKPDAAHGGSRGSHRVLYNSYSHGW